MGRILGGYFLLSVSHPPFLSCHLMVHFSFGYGNHVCPGRFFAVRLIKLVITKLLLDYDIKWARETNDRPPPVQVEGQFVPNMQQTIFLRRYSGAVSLVPFSG